jgi:CBS domain-containing protein
VVVIQKMDGITTALDLMIEQDFSQLPVVDEKGTLLGMITYESILRAVRSFNTKLDQLLVRDAVVAAPSHAREDNLFDLLDELKLTNAVVIVEPEGYVTGIVTSYDAARFLRNRTEDLMHVEDIEFIIKDLVKKFYAGEKHSSSRNAKPFEELNLGDYINLLLSREVWKFYAPILNIEKEVLSELLVKIRQTRNDLAHFRTEISPGSRDELRYCASWLRSRYQEYEKEDSHYINTLLGQHEQEELARVTQEGSAAYQVSGESDRAVQEGKLTSRSRYAALANWLAVQKEDQVLLTFEQIEMILRSLLPDSALQLRAWWANEQAGHSHSALWLAAGWKVVYVDLVERHVIFARRTSDEEE